MQISSSLMRQLRLLIRVLLEPGEIRQVDGRLWPGSQQSSYTQLDISAVIL